MKGNRLYGGRALAGWVSECGDARWVSLQASINRTRVDVAGVDHGLRYT